MKVKYLFPLILVMFLLNLQAEPLKYSKVALIIANWKYETNRLKYAGRDAVTLMTFLQEQGFHIISPEKSLNIKNKEKFQNLFESYKSSLVDGGTGIFYYTGHGSHLGDTNYFMPTSHSQNHKHDIYSYGKKFNDLTIIIESLKNTNQYILLDVFRDDTAYTGFIPTKIENATTLYSNQTGDTCSDNGQLRKVLIKVMNKNNASDSLMEEVQSKILRTSNECQKPILFKNKSLISASESLIHVDNDHSFVLKSNKFFSPDRSNTITIEQTGLFSFLYDTLEWENSYYFDFLNGKNSDSKLMNWEDAMKYCDDLVLDGKSDWHLPTVDELQTLNSDVLHFSRNNNFRYSILQQFVDNMPLLSSENASVWFWTSSAHEDFFGAAWMINFGNADKKRTYDDMSRNSFVRCVRNE